MQEKRLETAEGSLSYEIVGEKVSITGFSGLGSRLEVPPLIESYPVTGIGKKAFLSSKTLRGITLPPMLEEVGDWAFAYCDNLTEISFPKREIRFGRAVFLECAGLGRVDLYGLEKTDPGTEYGSITQNGDRGENGAVPELLAAAVTKLDAYYLLDLEEAGSREWLSKWDARLIAILHTPDQDGYSKQVLCGEEDYGSTDMGAFVSAKRRSKVRLAFLRLLHNRGLSSSLKAELETYLRSLTRGEAGEETWRVVLEEHGRDREYYNMFAELNCVTESNFDGLLADIGEDCPEMKAFFLRYKAENLGMADFFDGLKL